MYSLIGEWVLQPKILKTLYVIMGPYEWLACLLPLMSHRVNLHLTLSVRFHWTLRIKVSSSASVVMAKTENCTFGEYSEMR
jgi:hypothetical protein